MGQNAVEEIDRVEAGGNYGWNVMEGSRCYEPPRGCDRSGLRLPISEYTHRDGQSVTGGFVYRGDAIAALRGRYLFADFSSGTIWHIPADAEPVTEPAVLLRTGLNISSFGRDAAGELYVLDLRGGIHRLLPAE